MKNLLLIILLIAIVLPMVGQTDSVIVKKKDVFKNQIDLDVEFLGLSFSFKKKNKPSNLSFGLKLGFGLILSSPKNNQEYYENIYIQPIVNWGFKKTFFIETGPRASVIFIPDNNTQILVGISTSFFIRVWKIQIGTRTQVSFFGKQLQFSSSIIFSQEPIILRIPIN